MSVEIKCFFYKLQFCKLYVWYPTTSAAFIQQQVRVYYVGESQKATLIL